MCFSGISRFLAKGFVLCTPVFCDAAPEAGGEVGVDVLGELFPLREEGLEALGAHTGVFGGVDCSTALYDGVVEFVQELQGFGAAVGEVEGEGQAGSREGEHAWRGYVAEGFEDGQE